MADFRINVVVDPAAASRGIRRVNSELDRTVTTADRLRNTISRAFAVAGAAIGIRQIVQLADAYTTLTNRIRVATDGAAFSGVVLNRVFEIANRARVPVRELTSLYQRISVASNELGASQEEILTFVDATAQALATQGGAAAESAGALLQLSQALGNANIQAQEFNSLVDGAFPLVQAAARGLDRAGGSVSRLRQLILQGTVTNEQFFRAILSQSSAIEETFARTVPTISQSFAVLRNNITRYIGEADQANAVTSTFARGVILAANNLEEVTFALTAAAAAYILYSNSAAIASTARFISTQFQLVTAVLSGRASLIQGVAADRARAASAVAAAQAEATRTAALVASARAEAFRTGVTITGTNAEFARAAVLRQITILETQAAASSAALASAQASQAAVTGTLTRALVGLRSVLAPVLAVIGGIPGLIAGAVAALAFFSDEIRISSDGLATLEDLGVVTFEAISSSVSSAFQSLQNFGAELLGLFPDLSGFVSTVVEAFNTLFDSINITFEGIVTLGAQAADGVVGVFAGTVMAIIAAFRTLPSAIGDLFIRASNNAINAVEGLINTAIRGVNVVRQLADLDAIATTTLPRLESAFAGGAEGLGVAVRDAFLEGLNQSFLETSVGQLFDAAEVRARQRAAQIPPAAPELPPAATRELTIGADVQREIDDLRRTGQLLQLNNRERQIQSAIFQVESNLRRTLNSLEREGLENQLRINQGLNDRTEILDRINGPQLQLAATQEALNSLYADGSINLRQFNEELTDLIVNQAQLNISGGQGTFIDGFIVGIERMLEAARNFSSEAGRAFGEFFTQVNTGFGNAVGQAVVFGESFSDAVGNTARRAVADLISQFVQLGIQYILTGGIQQAQTTQQLAGIAAVQTATVTTNAVSTASSIAASTATTSAIVADNAVIAASAAPAAALQSTVSFGGAAIAGLAALAAILAFSNNAFADGGMVRGPGGPRSDSIPAMISNGEFVVNARSTARFRPLLEQINNPGAFQNGGPVGGDAPALSPQTQPSQQGQGGIRIVNVIDPSEVEGFLNSSSGERVIVNVIERNARSLQQILRNN